MLSYFTSFGASTEFERLRLQLTTKTLEGPSQTALAKLMLSFEGKDSETKPQIAYATIIRKIETSDSRDNWIYLMKNLIILDQMVENSCFIREVTQLQLPQIEDFLFRDGKYLGLGVETVLKQYWKLIKSEAAALQTRQSILYYSREERKDYLMRIDGYEVVKELEVLSRMFTLCFNVVSAVEGNSNSSPSTSSNQPNLYNTTESSRRKDEIYRSPLFDFLFKQLLFKLNKYYTCNLLAINRFLTLMKQENLFKGKSKFNGYSNEESIATSLLSRSPANQEGIRNARRLIAKYCDHAEGIIRFLNKYKHIEGFDQFDYRGFRPFQKQTILKMIDDYTAHLSNKEKETESDFLQPVGLKEEIIVHRAPHSLRLSGKMPRKQTKLVEAFEIKQELPNSFSNWINSYSPEFPQKEVMTLDLIMELKKEPSLNLSSDETIYGERQSHIFTIGQIHKMDHLHFKGLPTIDPPKFTSIFSRLEPQWNEEKQIQIS